LCSIIREYGHGFSLCIYYRFRGKFTLINKVLYWCICYIYVRVYVCIFVYYIYTFTAVYLCVYFCMLYMYVRIDFEANLLSSTRYYIDVYIYMCVYLCIHKTYCIYSYVFIVHINVYLCEYLTLIPFCSYQIGISMRERLMPGLPMILPP
jgi:hypothetical protein